LSSDPQGPPGRRHAEEQDSHDQERRGQAHGLRGAADQGGARQHRLRAWPSGGPRGVGDADDQEAQASAPVEDENPGI
jgi:hypothetical protein